MSPHKTLAKSVAVGSSTLIFLAVAGCSGNTDSSSKKSEPDFQATFTVAINADPGSLNPLASGLSAVQQIAGFLYDPLVHDQDGKLSAGLASKWSTSGSTVTFDLRPNVTCADGTALTAADVANTLNYVADPKNASPLAGITVPAGSRAEAGDDGKTVTLTTPQPSGFLLNGLAGLPIVCGSGLQHPDILTNEARGSGPYALESAKPGTEYRLSRRDDYTWGPGGESTGTKGLPKEVVVRVIPNETTAANLLLSGQLDAAIVAGADRSRLKSAGLSAVAAESIYGEFIYNQSPSRPTSSPEARLGLTRALNLEELRKVATSGFGTQPTRLTGASPCGEGGVASAIPKQDVQAAGDALSALKGKTLKLVYLSKLGPAVAAAADLAVEQWAKVGVKVVARGLSDTQLLNVAYKTGDFDIAWVPIDGQNPIQVVASFSGPGPAGGGGNFAGIENSTYDRLSAEAAVMPDTAGCDKWTEAEASLVSAADVVPFANSDYPMWASTRTRFKINYYGVSPMTVRMYK